jgi:predicted nucleotidyltransferase
MIERQTLLQTLREALLADPAVDAAWEGGSAAFGRDDALSDIDAVAVVADDAVGAVFAGVELALAQFSPIALRLDMPPQTGFAQKFYRLHDAGEFLVVDLALIRRSDPLLFREVELHGQGRTWFDRRGVLVEQHLDRAADQAVAAARVPVLLASFEMFQHLVLKEIARGHASDALAFYQAWTLRPLAEVLRLLHAPHTRIFGLRYLARDLPAAVAMQLETLMFVRDLAHLTQVHAQARAWFNRCATRLRAHGPGAGLAGVEQVRKDIAA